MHLIILIPNCAAPRGNTLNSQWQEKHHQPHVVQLQSVFSEGYSVANGIKSTHTTLETREKRSMFKEEEMWNCHELISIINMAAKCKNQCEHQNPWPLWLY